MWPRVDGLRSLELGTPGGLRETLNGLVLWGRKRATAGLLGDYEQEGEVLEHVGEDLALLDDEGRALAVVEITDVQVRRFADALGVRCSRGRGRRGPGAVAGVHRGYWAAQGTPVDDDTQVVCLRFVLSRRAATC